ncbi:hypothetical protein MY4038_008773 [Beauveria bassiana]
MTCSFLDRARRLWRDRAEVYAREAAPALGRSADVASMPLGTHQPRIDTAQTVILIDDSITTTNDDRREILTSLQRFMELYHASRENDGVETSMDVYFVGHRSQEAVPDGKCNGGFYGVAGWDSVQHILPHVRFIADLQIAPRLAAILRSYLGDVAFGAPVTALEVIVITSRLPDYDTRRASQYGKQLLEFFAAQKALFRVQFLVAGLPSSQRACSRNLRARPYTCALYQSIRSIRGM